jgi:hypothetical protein
MRLDVIVSWFDTISSLQPFPPMRQLPLALKVRF